jgi:hypothetical protein
MVDGNASLPAAGSWCPAEARHRAPLPVAS